METTIRVTNSTYAVDIILLSLFLAEEAKTLYLWPWLYTTPVRRFSRSTVPSSLHGMAWHGMVWIDTAAKRIYPGTLNLSKKSVKGHGLLDCFSRTKEAVR